MAELLALGVSSRPSPDGPGIGIPDCSAPGLTSNLVADGFASEAVLFSTDRLTELYMVCDDGLTAEASALAELAEWGGVTPSELADSVYALEAELAASHLFRIATGLDLGEGDLSPVRERLERARRMASDAGSSGPLLDRLFGDALAVAWPNGASGTDSELELIERRLDHEVGRFRAWWEVEGAGHPETDAAVVRLPFPGDAA